MPTTYIAQGRVFWHEDFAAGEFGSTAKSREAKIERTAALRAAGWDVIDLWRYATTRSYGIAVTPRVVRVEQAAVW